MSGPLSGLKFIEIAGLGPGPFCAMMLADMGAEVLRIDRRGKAGLSIVKGAYDVMARGRQAIQLDLKDPAEKDFLLDLIEAADGLVEGFRPGVMERLGLGPDVCLARNPNLIYGRMTGWGQDGPLKHAAGHDINHIALTGALHAIGPKDNPAIPLNLIGDFGGGGMMLAFGMVCAMLAAKTSGQGQVVDAAMTDGSALLMAMIYGFRGAGVWQDRRMSNLLDGTAPFYRTYETRDGKHVAIGALEPQFYALLLEKLEINDPDFATQMAPDKWPAMTEKLAAHFKTKTRDEWCDLMEGTDICFAPVLSLDEAPEHPHNKARGTFIEVDGVIQPAPAPRFSRTPASPPEPRSEEGEDLNGLTDWGLNQEQINLLKGG